MSVFSSQEVNPMSERSEARTYGHMKLEHRRGGVGKDHGVGIESLKGGAKIPSARSRSH